MSRIQFEDIENLKSNSAQLLDSVHTNANQLKVEIGVFTNLDRFRGATGRSLRAYFNDVHLSVLDAWKNCVSLYRLLLLRYSNGLEGVDSNRSAIIEAGYLIDYMNAATRLIPNYFYIGEDVSSFYSTYSEFLQSSKPKNDSEITELLGISRDKAKNQEENMGMLDADIFGAFGEVERLLDAIEAFTEKDMLGPRGNGFNRSALRGVAWFENLALTDEAIDLIYRSFYLNGELNYEFFANKLSLEGEGLSQATLLALVRLYMSPYLTYDQMVIIADLSIGTQVAFQQLGTALADILFDEVMLQAFGKDRLHCGIELENLLRRVQLLAFMGSVPQIWKDDINLNYFVDGNPPRIMLYGRPFYVSTLDCLLIPSHLITSFSMDSNRVWEELERKDPDLAKKIFTVALKLALGKHKVIGTGISVTLTLFDLLDYISQPQHAETLQVLGVDPGTLLINLTYALGGGGAYVFTPSGPLFIGPNFYTNSGVLNATFLESIGVSEGNMSSYGAGSVSELIVILSSSNYSYADFTEGLGEILNGKFSDWGITQLENLTVSQLFELVEVWEESQ